MSNYMKITETEVLSDTEHVKDCEVEALKEKVLLQMKQEEYQMKSKNMNNGKMMKRVAAAIVVLGIAAPTGVYAAGKLGVFDGLFGDKDTAPIEQYVENVNTEKGEASAVYQMETDDYIVAVDCFVYSEATDYGIVQFTLTDKMQRMSPGMKWLHGTSIIMTGRYGMRWRYLPVLGMTDFRFR